MSKSKWLYSIVLLVASVARSDVALNTSQSDRQRKIVMAINREICFEKNWYGIPYYMGRHVSVSISQMNNHTYVVGSGFRSSNRFNTIFDLVSAGNYYFIESARSYNKLYVSAPLTKASFRGKISFDTPRACTEVTSYSKYKLQMIKRIIEDRLDFFKKNGDQYPSFIIGPIQDYNTVSFVLLESTGEVFTIIIDHRLISVSEGGLKYNFGQVYDRDYVKRLIPKLKRIGIRYHPERG